MPCTTKGSTVTAELKCTACGEPATMTFDGLPACKDCLRIVLKTWPSGTITYPPLIPMIPMSYVEGADLLGNLLTRKP